MMPATFQVTPLFRETFAAKTQANPVLASKFNKFIEIKKADPNQLFGASDKPFKSGGIFSNAVPKIRHAHLTHDLSIVYTVVGGDQPVIQLHGIFSHDDMGTGQPSNLNRQRSLAAQFAGQTMSTADVSAQPRPERSPASKSTSPGPGYVARTKPVASPTENSFVKSVKSADQEWQQRGLLDRLMQAETRNEKLAVINSELQYLQTIVRRNQLYPNQQRYAEKLIQIYNTLTGAKK